jgi:hypothetical protein
MDNKIYEEALANVIRRIEELEDKISGISIPNKKVFYEPAKQIYNKQLNSELASPGQLKYIKILGGDPWPEMNKSEAGIEIDRLLQIKKTRESKQDYKIEEVNEPKEVDTEESGVDSEGFL